jgi:uncharacterized membrane protein
MVPPWPGWDGLHPLVIHFPIGLLLVAPLFVLLAIVFRRHASTLAVAAWVLLALGTVSTFVAVSTGQAAGELADHTAAINAVIEKHEELAETTRLVFSVLTVLYGAVLLAPRFLAAFRRPALVTAVNSVFLVLLLGGSLMVANTAHQGGVLVHQLGVHALMPPASGGVPAPSAPDDH